MNPLVREFIERSPRYASKDGETWYRVLPWTAVDSGCQCVDYNGPPETFVEDASWALKRPVVLADGMPPQ
jgi:hypothetical protein